mmetsp:Transcript_10150/g.23143  ORF Transcript_10150/g.23143 Transcript_10150/m.23143 type:complete len:128 (+) Transcript_10150:116-499(+)
MREERGATGSGGEGQTRQATMQMPEHSASAEPAIRVQIELPEFTVVQNVEVATVATTNTDDLESPDPAMFSVQDLDPDTGLPIAMPVESVRVDVVPLYWHKNTSWGKIALSGIAICIVLLLLFYPLM